MQRDHLFDATYDYSEPPAVTPGDGPGLLHGVGTGRIDGARLSGTARWSNLATRRASGDFEPDVRGAITTDDGALIFYRARGIARLTDDGERRMGVWVDFTTDDTRYAWLNDALVFEEGIVRGGSIASSAYVVNGT